MVRRGSAGFRLVACCTGIRKELKQPNPWENQNVTSNNRVLAFLATSMPAFASPCNGVDLAVGSVSVKNVTTSGSLNRYEIAGTVTNIGSLSQGADALQSVDIYQENQKLDSKAFRSRRPSPICFLTFLCGRLTPEMAPRICDFNLT